MDTPHNPEYAKLTFGSSDIWAFGCILYQMIAGRFAFQGLSEYLTWQKIKQLEYSFPDGFDERAKDLVQRLLVRFIPFHPPGFICNSCF
jgi:3-phosphoinositide dependent protein kinase-1